MVSRIAYRRGVARLIQTVVAIVFLAVFLSAADGIPNIDDDALDRLTILDLLRLGIPVLLVGLVIATRGAAHDVIAWHVGRMMRVGQDPARDHLASAVGSFADRMFNLIAVGATWILSWGAINLAVERYPDYDWALTVAVLAFVGLLLLALLGASQGLEPLLEETRLFGGVEAAAAQATVQAGIACSNCGTENPSGQRFCGGCGQGNCQNSGLGVLHGSDLVLPTPALRFEVGQLLASSRAEIGVEP
jgi:hypothetical protein